MVAGKKGFYLFTVRILVFVLVLGQLGVYGASGANALEVQEGVLASSNDSNYVLYLQDGKLKSNANPVELMWNRSESVSNATKPTARSQAILGLVNDISEVSYGTYQSTYTGEVKHAFLVEFSKLHEDYFQVEIVNGESVISRNDPLGLVTPTSVSKTETELLNLVINAETGRVIDLISNINPYYHSNEESYSFTPEITGIKEPSVPTEIPTVEMTKVDDRSAELNWNIVSQATAYEIEVNGSLKGQSYINRWIDNSLNPNSNYDFRVRAVNSFGASEWSETYSVTTLLEKPSLDIFPIAKKNTVQWSTVAGADFYQLQIDNNEPIQVNNATSYEHVGLIPGYSHTYKVKAISTDNESPWSNTLTQLTVSDYESGLKVEDAKANLIKVSWQSVSGATGYELEIDGKSVAVSGTSYTKTGLTPDTQHTFRIRTKNKLEVGSWSDPVLGLTQLATPVLKVSSLSSQETELFWPLVKGASYYEIEMDGIVVGRSIDPAYIVNGLNPGESHKYRIRALSDTNESAWTGIVTQVTHPDEVSGLNVSAASNKSLTLKWNAVKGATAYDLKLDGVVLSVSGTSYVKNNLLPDTDYIVQIRSKNAAGTSSWSSIVIGKTLLNTPVVKSESGEKQIDLSWSSIVGASHYEIEADGIVVDLTNETQYTHKALAEGKTHKYRVRAVTDSNHSEWSTLVSSSTLPGSVNDFKVSTVTNTSITLNWVPVPGATGYDLEVDGKRILVTGSAYTKSGLASDTNHTFRIRSKNAAGTSAWSEEISVLTQIAKPVLKGTPTKTSVTLSWAVVPNATSYEIEADGVVVGVTNEQIYVHSELSTLSTHKYRIRALNSSNASSWSTMVSVRTLK
ncbi:fibronectin type III domain-containing protein [Paenibacillus xylanexedens]|uniref:fibronectin type III domain-containing protein n=1 Tax=Paenibacillus xylanexedens TaxID=528191 RepID=UPI0011A8C68B|nr:fibronectin type III domain-containing protein [Paenibacillus xylanexedens]